MKKKVCIIGLLSGNGGLERSCSNLSKLLTENGYSVTMVGLNGYPTIDFEGDFFDMSQYKTEGDNIIKRLITFRKLRTFFKQNKFDYILDNRSGNLPFRELYYRIYIYGLKSKIIYMMRNSEFLIHFPKPSVITNYLVKKSFAIIGVSKGVSTKFNLDYKTSKSIPIYNYVEEIKPQTSKEKYPDNCILYLGRLVDYDKNLSLLLESYMLSHLYPDVKLVIKGNGKDEEFIKNKVNEMGLKPYVHFYPYSTNIYNVLTQAKFLILTSRFEGFGRVLVEALNAGTPVVSVDCESGPSEIVKNEENGLLVENYNAKKLSDAMRRMFEDEDLYQHCKANAKNSICNMSKSHIASEWMSILK